MNYFSNFIVDLLARLYNLFNINIQLSDSIRINLSTLIFLFPMFFLILKILINQGGDSKND